MHQRREEQPHSGTSASPQAGSGKLARSGFRAGGLLVALLLPALSAAWLVPGFVTQDGPCHLYNGWILREALSTGSPYAAYYEIRWQPLPNWAGHLATAGLLWVVPPWVADRILITTTALGLAGALVWLRWRVHGAGSLGPACLLAAIVALNFLWLMGFTSFLLGCILFCVTLGVWWTGRDGLSPGRQTAIAVLLVLGYFAHLVSLGLTVLALGFLAVLGPVQAGMKGTVALRHRGALLARTAACGIPLLALAPAYLEISTQGGPMRLAWENLGDPSSLSSWLARLGWIDPLSLCRKSALPFTERSSALFAALAPIAWLLLAGAVLAWGWVCSLGRAWCRREDLGERSQDRAGRVWTLLGILLISAGLLGPDSLGPGHGEYLPQRLTLLGLAALVPGLDMNFDSRRVRAAVAALGVALGLQTLIVWDYALHSDRTAGQVIRAGPLVGRGQRVATLLIGIRSRFRANPLLHVDTWLGIGTGNIFWSNYETRYYYFPVQFRPGLRRPNPRSLEDLANSTDPVPGAGSVRMWQSILTDHGADIDRVLVWGEDARLEAITAAWGERIARRGNVSVHAPRDRPR